jgi:GAF domain-containing protein
MSEEFKIPQSERTKKEKYEILISQIESLLENETDLIANMSNIASALKFTFNFLWVGFYMVKEKQLVLGPFQGPVACTRIEEGMGVCGIAWQNKSTIIVPDVLKFPGHIACSSDSKSEIVIPGISKKKVIFVLDIDSSALNTFNEVDKEYLEHIIRILLKYSDC